MGEQKKEVKGLKIKHGLKFALWFTFFANAVVSIINHHVSLEGLLKILISIVIMGFLYLGEKVGK